MILVLISIVIFIIINNLVWYLLIKDLKGCTCGNVENGNENLRNMDVWN